MSLSVLLLLQEYKSLMEWAKRVAERPAVRQGCTEAEVGKHSGRTVLYPVVTYS